MRVCGNRFVELADVNPLTSAPKVAAHPAYFGVVRRTIALSGLIGAVLAATALAAPADTVSLTLSPSKAGRRSTVHVLAQGPFPGVSGGATSVVVDAARGFKADPRAVSVLCSAAQASARACPAASQIGHGTIATHVTTSIGAGSGDYNITADSYLAPKQQAGDIAGVVLLASTQTATGPQYFDTTGRLLKPASGPYGVELRFDNFPAVQSPVPGVTLTATVNSIELFAGASRKVTTGTGKHRRTKTYSLFTNPPTCRRTWTGRFMAVFTTGTVTRTLTTACTRR
ncbi:MAG TPA: hypothetical protein VG325_19945 [Solirubrobacteraceae bacterium]|jgi:hypothetical protein|nr:hypothetical protein [Solirubrobacteraceae bacterium]